MSGSVKADVVETAGNTLSFRAGDDGWCCAIFCLDNKTHAKR